MNHRVFIFAFILFCVAVQAEIVDVDFGSLATLAASAKAGAGTYSNIVVDFSATGTREAPITVSGYGVTLTGVSAFKFGGESLIVEGFQFVGGNSSESNDVIQFRTARRVACNYCTLRNVSVIAFNPLGNLTIDYKYNTVEKCLFQDKNHMGTTVVVWRTEGVEDYHLISQNIFLRRVTHFNLNGQEAIRIGTSSTQGPSYTIVEYNQFIEQNGEGETISSKSYYNIFRYNTFLRTVGALTLRHADYNEVYGNKFYGEGIMQTSGVRVCWGTGHLIYNNYFENLGNPRGNLRGAIVLMNGESDPLPHTYKRITNLTVAFNTIRNCYANIVIGSNATAHGPYAPSNFTIAYNIIVGNNNPIINYVNQPTNAVFYKNIASGRANQPTVDGWETTDPHFLNETGYLLSAESPAIGAATGYDFVSIDIDKFSRGSIKDSGASEYEPAEETTTTTTGEATTTSSSSSSSDSSSSTTSSSSSSSSSNPNPGTTTGDEDVSSSAFVILPALSTLALILVLSGF